MAQTCSPTTRSNVGILMNDVSSDAQRYGIPAGAYVEAVLEMFVQKLRCVIEEVEPDDD